MNEIKSSKETLAKWLTLLENGLGEFGAEFISTGFVCGSTSLDHALGGGLTEGLYILGAEPSLGKTTLAMQIMDNIAKSGHDVLIFSLEMAKRELILKSISRETAAFCMTNGLKLDNGLSIRGIISKYKNGTDLDKEIINGARERYSECKEHIYVLEGVGDFGIKEVRAGVTKHIRLTGRKPVVLIDYLQILAPGQQDIGCTDKQVVDRNVIELKRISRDFKIPVLAISSLNRFSYNKVNNLGAFKESGGIEYGADVVMRLLFRNADTKDFDIDCEMRRTPRKMLLKIMKNRNGEVGRVVPLEYFPKVNFFRGV